MTSSRLKGFSAAALVLAVTLGATGCAGSASSERAGNATDSATIKIGVATPLSGPLAVYGEKQLSGVQFAVDEVNAAGGIDGRMVELSQTDSLGTPDGAIAATQRLVREDGAKFLTGLVSTAEWSAVTPRLAGLGALGVGTQSIANELTGANCVPDFFRATMRHTSDITALKDWMGDQDVEQWDTIGADYSFGQDSAAGVKANAESIGDTVNTTVFAPLGTTDYASFINQLSGEGGLVVALPGSDAINFFQQALNFGLLQKYTVVMSDVGLQEEVLNAIDNPGMEGVYATTNWEPSLDTPESQQFVADFTEATGTPPSSINGYSYLAMQTLFAGIRAAGSADPAAVRDALQGLSFDSLHGEVTMNADDHQLEVPVYIAQIETDDEGALVAIPDVTVPASVNNPEPDPACQL